MTQRFDIVVVGAGIVGLATARALSERRPAASILVLEKEHDIGRHQTGHASGVVHRGVYYTPGSQKAMLCVDGAARLLDYCGERGIPVLRCGKVVVASDAGELGRLEELMRRSQANGVPGVELIGPDRLRELEPHASGVGALYSPDTSVVDFGLVARAYSDDIRAAGGVIQLRTTVVGITRRGALTSIETDAGAYETDLVVTCAGLHSDRLARRSGGATGPTIVPFRGDYVRLKPSRRYLSRGLIYPVPDPAFPFLGIHTTLRPDGEVWIGPNAVLAFAREGYRRRDASARDLREVVGFRGFRRLARAHWRTGSGELARDLSLSLFVRAARRLLPELETSDVEWGPSGIRAQALDEHGALVDDFVLDEARGIVHVRNAPSPGATSSLAIGDWIADRALSQTSSGAG